MCGIAGQVNAQRDFDPKVVKSLLANLVHRGPDGEGLYKSGHVTIGMRRLSIIDPEGGWQPLYNEDHSVAVVTNGEIYNYVELRNELIARGHVFRTKSDCEVIPHLYEELGPDFVTKLRGMFVIALWDETRRRLILVRDRMGEKPLYLIRGKNELVFASELKAILASGRSRAALDPQALAEFLHYGFVVEPRTPFLDVRKLPAASMLVVDVDPWRCEEKTYWSAMNAEPVENGSPAALAEKLDDVGRLIVRSDVPVGIALSGGVDSSLVACMASRHNNGALTAISIGYEGAGSDDESGAAEWLARRMGWNFIRSEVRDEDAVRQFDNVVASRDDPITDITGICYHQLNEIARESGIRVMLYGQGGDELFWGYRWTRMAAMANRLIAGEKRSALPWRRMLAPASSAPLELARWAVRERFGLRTFSRISQAVSESGGLPVLYGIDDGFRDLFQRRNRLFGQDFAEKIDPELLKRPCGSELDRHGGELEAIRVLMATYLMQNGIAQGDRLSMCSSVEVRLPLVDHVLVEHVIGTKKVRSDLGDPAKAALIDAARSLVPPEVFSRPKRGFAPPARRWYQKLTSAYGDRLLDGVTSSLGLFRPEIAKELAMGGVASSGAFPLHYRALVLESWLRAAEQWIGRPLFMGDPSPHERSA